MSILGLKKLRHHSTHPGSLQLWLFKRTLSSEPPSCGHSEHLSVAADAETTFLPSEVSSLLAHLHPPLLAACGVWAGYWFPSDAVGNRRSIWNQANLNTDLNYNLSGVHRPLWSLSWLCTRMWQNREMGWLCCMEKCIWSIWWRAFAWEKLFSSVEGTETKQEFPSDSNTHTHNEKTHETVKLVSASILVTSTHSCDGFKLHGEGAHPGEVDLVVKASEVASQLLSWVMWRWCVGGQTAVSITCNQQWEEFSGLRINCDDCHNWGSAGHTVWVWVNLK